MDEPHETRWWASYFDEDFVRLYRPFLTPEQTATEVDAVIEALGLEPGNAVLDLGCGWGRHAVPLAEAGCVVTGVDLSEVLLRHARAAAAEAEVEVEWVRADVRELPWSGRFDAVVSLFSSLGYFGADREDARALAAARRALRDDGLLLLETMHRDQVARGYAERDWWTGDEGETVWVERAFDAVDGVSREWLRWRGEAGAGEKYHEVRVRSATEWRALLHQAGFEAMGWYGDWDLSPFDVGAERLVVVARPTG